MTSQHIIKAEEWWNAVKKSWQIQEEYGVTVDPALILQVPKPILAVFGMNKQIFNAARPSEFMARPIAYQVKDNYIIVKYPNGVKAFLRLRGNSEEERVKYALKVARSWHIVASNGRGYAVKEIMDLHADTEAAKNVVQQYGKRATLAMALGLRPEALDHYWHRTAVLITKAHIMEISQPSTGKTTFAWYVTRVLGGIVVNEPPTPTFLAGDARDGSFGIAFTSNTIIFDEVDKWHKKDSSLNQTLDILLSGMENCNWVRGAGRGLSYSKCVSSAWLGNTPAMVVEMPKDREKIAEIMSKLLKANVKPLLDRISIIALDVPRFKTDFLGDMLRPAVTRGLSKILTEEAMARWDSLRQEGWDARSAWHIAIITTLLSWIRESDVSVDDAVAVYKLLE
jgi:hypothetical protein